MLFEILTFIIDTVTGLFAGFLLLRFWMQAQRVRPPSGLAQTIFQLTDWLVHPLRRILPGFGGYDWASMLAVFLVALVAVGIEYWLMARFPLTVLLGLALFKLAQWILYGLMFMLILEAVFSWVNPHAPIAPLIRMLNEPLLKPIRKILPALGGLDFSPLVALIILQILLKVLNEFLVRALMFSA